MAPEDAAPGDRVAPMDPIDLSQLDNIAADDSEKTEILHEFLTQTRMDFAELQTALDKRDIPATLRIAHRIKGSSRMVGAGELASVCMAMEQAGRQGSLEVAMTAITELNRVLHWLEVHLDATAAGSTVSR